MKVTVNIEGDVKAVFVVETPGKITGEMLDALNDSIKTELHIPASISQQVTKIIHEHEYIRDYWKPYWQSYTPIWTTADPPLSGTWYGSASTTASGDQFKVSYSIG